MIDIPDDWTTHHATGVPLSIRTPTTLREHEPVSGTVLVVVDDTLPEQFRPSVNVVANRLDGLDQAAWHEQSDQLMRDVVRPQVHIDTEAPVLDRFRRTVRYYEDPASGGVAMEQYAVAERDHGVIITCTCSALEHPQLSEGFVRIAATLRWEDAP